MVDAYDAVSLDGWMLSFFTCKKVGPSFPQSVSQ